MGQRAVRGEDTIVASDLIRNEVGLFLVFESLHGFVALLGGVPPRYHKRRVIFSIPYVSQRDSSYANDISCSLKAGSFYDVT